MAYQVVVVVVDQETTKAVYVTDTETATMDDLAQAKLVADIMAGVSPTYGTFRDAARSAFPELEDGS